MGTKAAPSFQGKIVQVSMQQITLPNGHRMEMEVVRHPGGSAVVALDDQQRVCMLRQYRCVFEDWLWELPAGKRDAQEAPLLTAQRELREEAGLSAGHWRDLGSMVSSPGVFTERVYLFLAQQLAQGAAQPAGDEVYELHWLSLDEAYQRVLSGAIVDAKTALGIVKARALV